MRHLILLLSCCVCLPAPTGAALGLPPPWAIPWFLFAIAKTFGAVNDIIGLSWDIAVARGSRTDAKCALCDRVMDLMLSGDADGSVQSFSCAGICLGMKKCITVCDKLTSALRTSSRFPCVAAGYCPEVDDFGELPRCRYRFPAKCEPSHLCNFNMEGPLKMIPKCTVNDGFRKWRKMNVVMSRHVGALAHAFRKLPRCGETDSHKVFCVNEPYGLGLLSMRLGYIVLAWAGVQSIRAIESSGGDHIQWLSFWIIYVLITTVEHVSDVLLSWMPVYYEAKLALLTWLVFFDGADRMYRSVHRCFDATYELLVWLKVLEREVFVEWDEEDYLETLPDALADDIVNLGGLCQAFTGLHGEADVTDRFGIRRGKQLLKHFSRIQPRFVKVSLLRATSLESASSTLSAEDALSYHVRLSLIQNAPKTPSVASTRFRQGSVFLSNLLGRGGHIIDSASDRCDVKSHGDLNGGRVSPADGEVLSVEVGDGVLDSSMSKSRGSGMLPEDLVLELDSEDTHGGGSSKEGPDDDAVHKRPLSPTVEPSISAPNTPETPYKRSSSNSTPPPPPTPETPHHKRTIPESTPPPPPTPEIARKHPGRNATPPPPPTPEAAFDRPSSTSTPPPPPTPDTAHKRPLSPTLRRNSSPASIRDRRRLSWQIDSVDENRDQDQHQGSAGRPGLAALELGSEERRHTTVQPLRVAVPSSTMPAKYSYAKVKSKCVLPFEERGSKSTARTSCEWNQEFEMYLEGQAGSALSVSRKNTRSNAPFTKLKLQLWAIDATGEEVHIGDGFVDLSLLMHCKTVYVDVPITSGSQQTGCDSWHGSGASPAQRRAKWRKIAATPRATVVNQEDPDVRVHGGAGDEKDVHLRVSLKWSPEALLEGSLVTEETRAEHRRLRLVGGSMEDSAPCRNDRLKKIRESLAESVNSAFSATRKSLSHARESLSNSAFSRTLSAKLWAHKERSSTEGGDESEFLPWVSRAVSVPLPASDFGNQDRSKSSFSSGYSIKEGAVYDKGESLEVPPSRLEPRTPDTNHDRRVSVTITPPTTPKTGDRDSGTSSLSRYFPSPPPGNLDEESETD